MRGFGGAYFKTSDARRSGKKRTMHVFMKKGRRKGLMTALEHANPKSPNSVLSRLQAHAGEGRVEIHEGKYSFEKIAKWKYMATGLVSGSNVVSVDADEGRNRVVMGVTSLQDTTDIEQMLSQKNIPKAAITFEKQRPVHTSKTLDDEFNVMAGGIRINGNCTMGPVTTLYVEGADEYRNSAPPGFLTAAHCTSTRHRVESTRFDQGSNFIGKEVREVAEISEVDGPPQHENYEDETGADHCPNGYRCYYGDAAFVQFTDDTFWDVQIAQTDTWNNESIELNSSNTRFDVTSWVATYHDDDDEPMQGELLDKVGQNTGWTYGALESTCENYTSISGSSETGILCQNRVDRGGSDAPIAQPGDSGSPVFDLYEDDTEGSDDVEVRGILWGGPIRAPFDYFLYTPSRMYFAYGFDGDLMGQSDPASPPDNRQNRP